MKNQIRQLSDWWREQKRLSREWELLENVEYQKVLDELLQTKKELERANLYLDVFVGACKPDAYTSRVCERGTKGCGIYHGRYW